MLVQLKEDVVPIAKSEGSVSLREIGAGLEPHRETRTGKHRRLIYSKAYHSKAFRIGCNGLCCKLELSANQTK
jgi:hypothetical protein